MSGKRAGGRKRWGALTSLIALGWAVGRIYHAPLIYAANRRDEFDRICFRDALDCAGLNNDSPLAAATARDEKVPTAGGQAQAPGLARLHRRYTRLAAEQPKAALR